MVLKNKGKNVYASVVLYKTSPIEVQSVLVNLSGVGDLSEIIVVDNSPNDDLSKICGGYSNLRYIFNPSNPGYGAAHNIAISLAIKAGADYHIISNSDVFVEKDVINHLVNVCSENPRVGIIAPAVKDINGELQHSRKRIPNIVDMAIRVLLPCLKNGSRSRFYEMRDISHRDPIMAPYLSGCFMMLNLSAVKELGGFDERFFMYPEDIDITRRIAERYLSVYDPRVSITHTHRAESKKSLKMFLIHVLNMIKYFNKWGWIFDSKRSSLNKKAGTTIFLK